MRGSVAPDMTAPNIECSDGSEFARDLHATFTVVDRPQGAAPVDHDWMYRYPGLFTVHLERLGLKALS